MNILQNRIDSFSNSSIQWPYLKKRYLQPDNLAKAGFYFMHKSDHVRCFLCDIELSEWKQGQSPYTRHINESPSCPLVLLQFPERSSRLIKNKAIAQPFDLTRRNARLATFNYHKYWPPHQRRKRSYPSVTKLADTGFYFSPTLDYIARVVCPYCKSAITEPDKSIDFLGRHREHCIFLDGTPDEIKGAITTDRRNTASSTSSVETYKTAGSGSSIMNERSSISQKRKRVADEVSPSLTRSKLQKLDEEYAQNENDNSIWDIGKVLALPTPVRKPTYTFGSKKSKRPQHHERQLASSKTAGSVNIFASLNMGDTAQQQPSRSSSSTLPMSFIVRPQSKPVLKTTELSETAAKNSSNSNDTDAESLVSSKMSPTTQKDGDTTAVATAQMQVHSTDSTMMASSIKQTNEGRQLLAEASPDTSPNVSEKRQSGSLKMTTDENSRPQGVDTITPSSPSLPTKKDKGKDKADIPHTTLLYPPSVPNRTTKELSTARLSSQHLPSQKRPSLSLSKTKTIEQRQQLQETPLRQSPHHLFHQTLTVQEERLYLQSTPQRGNGVVHAHTIFGDDLPFSPIRGTSTSGVLNSSSSTATQNHAATSIHHISNIAYPDTPMLASGRLRPFGQQTSSLASPSTVPHTPSRLSHQRPLQSSSTGTTLTRDEQGEEENGKQKGRQLPLERPNLPSLDDIPPPDVSNFVLTLSEKEKNMTVEEFIQAIIDTNVQKVKERGEDMMKQIRARSDQVKIQLLKQKGQLR